MIKPTFKLTTNNLDDNTAEIIIEPLPKNFGHTIGNALRRVLLGSLTGAAAIRFKVAGVNHQFSTLSGLQEDILELALNLKETRFVLETDETATIRLNVKGKKTVTAGDLELPANVRVVNPGHQLARLTSPQAKLSATIEIALGVGYQPSEKHATDEIGVIPLDASFSPIIRANYKVEATRVGRQTDLDKLRLIVATDGSIDPQSAVLKAAHLLTDFFNHVHSPKFIQEPVEEDTSPIQPNSVEELDLPIRIINSLKKGGYEKFSDLTGVTVDDLTKVKNIGEKSAKEILARFKQKTS